MASRKSKVGQHELAVFFLESSDHHVCSERNHRVFRSSYHTAFLCALFIYNLKLAEWMSRSSGISVDDLVPYLFLLRDKDCITHLMRVSSGLESLVLGEGQILAQVKQVYQTGQSINGFGRYNKHRCLDRKK